PGRRRRRARGRRRRRRAARRPDRLRVAAKGLRRAGAERPSPRDLAAVRAPHVTRRTRTAALVATPEWVGVYFVARDLHGRQRLRRGQQFPSQCKQDVRPWASAFGESESTPFHEFRFVEVLLARADLAQEIVSRGLSLDEAVAFLAANLEGVR